MSNLETDKEQAGVDQLPQSVDDSQQTSTLADLDLLDGTKPTITNEEQSQFSKPSAPVDLEGAAAAVANENVDNNDRDKTSQKSPTATKETAGEAKEAQLRDGGEQTNQSKLPVADVEEGKSAAFNEEQLTENKNNEKLKSAEPTNKDVAASDADKEGSIEEEKQAVDSKKNNKDQSALRKTEKVSTAVNGTQSSVLGEEMTPDEKAIAKTAQELVGVEEIDAADGSIKQPPRKRLVSTNSMELDNATTVSESMNEDDKVSHRKGSVI